MYFNKFFLLSAIPVAFAKVQYLVCNTCDLMKRFPY